MTAWLVTGGLGFIGSELVRQLVLEGESVAVCDSDTYAGDRRRLVEVRDRFALRQVDVADPAFDEVVSELLPRRIIHLAAETHVTRSENAEELFFRTNLEGTRRVLESAERIGVELVVHVSTDEVYGPCHGEPFNESEKAPGEGLATSPYARSKALADDLAQSFSDRVPTITVRPTNCFGRWQHPEKAIPRWIIRAIAGERLPVWGDGQQVRDWMHVSDAALGLRTIALQGAPGEVFNLAPAGEQTTNLEVALQIADAAGLPQDAVYLTAYDRPQHDRRYAVDATKVRELGWSARVGFAEGIGETVEWYRGHAEWWEPLVDAAEALYDDEVEQSA